MITLATLVGTLAPLTSPAPFDVTTVPATVTTIDLTNREAQPAVSPLSVRITLGDVPQGTGVPADLTDVAYGTGKAGKRDVAVLVGKSDAGKEQVDVLVIDSNSNGKFEDSERHAMTVEVRDQRGTEMAVSKPVDGSLAGGAKFAASYMKGGGRAATAQLIFNRYLEGIIPAGRIAVVDKDFDGTFGSIGDAWAITPKDGRAATEYGLMNLDESVFIDGHRYRIGIAGEMMSVASEAADGPDPAVAAAQRARVEHMWMERFEPGRKEFFEQRGLDSSRPLATVPVKWHYVTYADALAMGAKENKPVFIDVMAFWCVWCYRMDWSTYCDAEVAKTLNEDFIAVKIIQEQDLVGDYDLVMKGKLEARGIPAMGIFDAQGNVLHTIGGWKKPEDFLTELATGKQKFAGQ
jgi:thiol-disulfide isomerase/thioredoxin